MSQGIETDFEGGLPSVMKDEALAALTIAMLVLKLGGKVTLTQADADAMFGLGMQEYLEEGKRTFIITTGEGERH